MKKYDTLFIDLLEVDIMFKQIKNRISEKNIKIEIDKTAKQLIIKKGTDISYGARPLRRAIQNMLEDKIAEEMLNGNLKFGDIAKITAEDGEIQIKVN